MGFKGIKVNFVLWSMPLMQFKKFHRLRCIPALPIQNSLSFRLRGRVFLTIPSIHCPSAEDTFSMQKVQNGPALSIALSMCDFASWPEFCRWSSVCIISFRLRKPKYFLSLLSQEALVSIAAHRNAAWLSSVPYQNLLAIGQLWQQLHCLSCIPGCVSVWLSRMDEGQVSPSTHCFMSTSSFSGSSISSRFSRPTDH